jgi:hypothetical protein
VVSDGVGNNSIVNPVWGLDSYEQSLGFVSYRSDRLKARRPVALEWARTGTIRQWRRAKVAQWWVASDDSGDTNCYGSRHRLSHV